MKKGDKIVVIYNGQFITNIGEILEEDELTFSTPFGSFYKTTKVSTLSPHKKIELLTKEREDIYEAAVLAGEISQLMKEFLLMFNRRANLSTVLVELRILRKMLLAIRAVL